MERYQQRQVTVVGVQPVPYQIDPVAFAASFAFAGTFETVPSVVAVASYRRSC
jgi:hypothetical protein